MLKKPIFIVGHPRSGTSLVRSMLERGKGVWTIGREGKPIWEHDLVKSLHPRSQGWHSNELGAHDVTTEVASSLTHALIMAARRPGPEWSPEDKLDFLEFMAAQGVNPHYYDAPRDMLVRRFPGPAPEGPPTARDGEELDEISPFCFPPRGRRPTAAELADGIRLVEKSIQSCFRVPFLRKVFPDAKFVFVVRAPQASIASLLEAWLHPRMFFSYKVPVRLQIEGYSDVFPWGSQWWNLSLPPGWRGLATQPLPDVCAQSWSIHNASVLRAYRELDGTGDAVLVRYEDVVSEPARVMAEVAAAVELPMSDAWREGALPVVMTQTPPSQDKWRRHEKTVRHVLPQVSPLAEELGYPMPDK